MRTRSRIKSFLSFFFLICLLILFSPSLHAFNLEGKVKLDPPLPEPTWLEIPEKDASACGPRKLSPKLRISKEGYIANVVVWLEGHFAGEKISSEKKYVLDQVNCEFFPHVLLIPRSAALSILNSDETLHNVRAFDEKAQMLFNDAMPKKGQVLEKHFGEPGFIIHRCGVHPWMHAMVVVEEHPFYVLTNEEGYFKIEGIPEGNYTLSLWHETLGRMSVKVDPRTAFLALTYPALPKTVTPSESDTASSK